MFGGSVRTPGNQRRRNGHVVRPNVDNQHMDAKRGFYKALDGSAREILKTAEAAVSGEGASTSELVHLRLDFRLLRRRCDRLLEAGQSLIEPDEVLGESGAR